MTIGRIPSVEGGIQPTIVDAKGDLIAGVAADSINRLAVGSNDQVLVADSSTSTGLAWKSVATPFAAGKNALINGDFRINQRGFSSTTSSGTYGFDRWMMQGSGGTITYSAQTFTPGTAPVAGYEGVNFARIVTSGQSGVNDYARLVQRVEDVRVFANQTVTVSFWAKAASGTPFVGVTIEQDFIGVLVPNIATRKTITTSWARYSFTLTLPTIAGKTLNTGNYLGVEIFTSCGTGLSAYSDVGVQNATIDIWGVQIEAGNVATPFQTATGTLQGELAACQRYYEKSYNIDVAPATNTQVGMVYQTGATDNVGNLGALIQFKVVKRATPTITPYREDGANNNWQYGRNGVGVTDASITWGFGGQSSVFPYLNAGSSFVPAFLKGHWAASAEL